MLSYGLYAADETPVDATNIKLIQGSLENSNVRPIIEMTRMMSISKEYQSLQNFIKKEHERQQKAIERLARIS